MAQGQGSFQQTGSASGTLGVTYLRFYRSEGTPRAGFRLAENLQQSRQLYLIACPCAGAMSLDQTD